MFKAQAVILAGGVGSRLKPFTTVIPKPLIPIDDMPIIEIIIRQLKHYGFKDIIISTGYLSEIIRACLGDGKKWGVNIQYVHEAKPKGTAGALKLVKHFDDDFLVINGDVLTDLNLKSFMAKHKKNKNFATIAVKERIVKTNFGVVEFDKKYILNTYKEKPEHRSFVSMGVNVFSKKAPSFIRAQENIGMPDFLLRIKSKGKIVSCFPHSSHWLDLGRFDDLDEAQRIWRSNRNCFLKS